MMKRLCVCVFLAFVLCCSSFADSLTADLDLTLLDGNLLISKASEIRSNPQTYAGKVIRLRGQYYADSQAPDAYRVLILSECSGNTCVEVGLKLVPSEGIDISWPENNKIIEVTALIESAVSSSGEVFSLLNVLAAD